ncbi:MAG: hypothetical protein H8J66_05070 [Nitrospira sp.]|nr:hypothetical protein [Nitrospira sp.]
MTERRCKHGMISLAAIACTAIGCVSVPTPLNLTSLDPAADQRKIADYYRQDALFLRLKAREMAERIVTYQGLFGAESEWVNGARLLEQFYENTAKDQDHQTLLHLSIADDRRAWSIDRRPSLHPSGQVK